MVVRTKGARCRNRAIFIRKFPKNKKENMAASTTSSFPTSQEGVATSSQQNLDAITDDDFEYVDEEFVLSHSAEQQAQPEPMIPDLFKQPSLVKDDLITATSQLQDQTVEHCLPFLTGEDGPLDLNDYGLPKLNRDKHIKFLKQSLGPLPGRFVAVDASRPWYLYWCLSGLTMMGEDVSSYRDSVIETARTMQNESGGFGGGHGQTSHLATTYAVILAIALVGGEEAYDVIDKKAMWKWLCSLKQPDGGFQVCVGGEEDIRGAYIAAVIITLLDLPLDLTPESPAYDGRSNLLTGLAEYVRSCQTFEGGISSQPNNEAHGAYAFCALACLAILDNPRRIIPSYLDVPRLVSWLSYRQYAPEGGFSGRTNKLVDGCYSHWAGGCFPLIEASLSPSGPGSEKHKTATGLAAAPESLYSREGLIRYILCCCQDQTKRGGLRDKPYKMSDPYHTNYVLSGLSSAQHQWDLDSDPLPLPNGDTTPSLAAVGADSVWNVFPYIDENDQIYEDSDRVRPIHPAYAIPQKNVNAIRAYFQGRSGFASTLGEE
ncbi:terpenoid cyclases/Protein prenyltransferase [Neurospora hispaniola]|uniref:Protein farnesyltransferase subunit beta n=1 Tax=Neurospora hispaniola TaxID=588809 RepID=A0AAJ0I7T9_9PEZI|nr:terpenoid cyclases/Protein prenyltransferase [Neurospora hispaniola]